MNTSKKTSAGRWVLRAVLLILGLALIYSQYAYGTQGYTAYQYMVLDRTADPGWYMERMTLFYACLVLSIFNLELLILTWYAFARSLREGASRPLRPPRVPRNRSMLISLALMLLTMLLFVAQQHAEAEYTLAKLRQEEVLVGYIERVCRTYGAMLIAGETWLISFVYNIWAMARRYRIAKRERDAEA